MFTFRQATKTGDGLSEQNRERFERNESGRPQVEDRKQAATLTGHPAAHGGEDKGQDRMSTRVDNAEVKSRLSALYDELITHDGFAEMSVEIRLLKRGQKEVILHCGRQYRFVINCPDAPGR